MKNISLIFLVTSILSSCMPATPTIAPSPTATTTLALTPTLIAPPTSTHTPTITPTPFPLTFIYQDTVPASARALQEESANKAYAYFSQYAELGTITIYTFSDLEPYLDALFPLLKSDIPTMRKSYFRSSWPNTGGTMAQRTVLVNTLFYAWQNDEALCYKASNVAHEMFHIVQSILMKHALFRPQLDYGPEWLKEGSAQVMGMHIADGLNGCSYQRDGIDWWRVDAADGVLLQSVEGGNFSVKPKFWSVAPLAVDYLIQISPGGEKSLIDYYSEIGAGATWRRAFQDAFGMTQEEFYQKFQKDVIAILPTPEPTSSVAMEPTPTLPEGAAHVTGNLVLADKTQKFQDYVISFCDLEIIQCLPGASINGSGLFSKDLAPGQYRISVNPINGGEALGWYVQDGLVSDVNCASIFSVAKNENTAITIDLKNGRCVPMATSTPEISIPATGTIVSKDTTQKFSDFEVTFCNIQSDLCLPAVPVLPDGTFFIQLPVGKYRIRINSRSAAQIVGWYTKQGLVVDPTCAQVITVDVKHETILAINLQAQSCE